MVLSLVHSNISARWFLSSPSACRTSGASKNPNWPGHNGGHWQKCSNLEVPWVLIFMLFFGCLFLWRIVGYTLDCLTIASFGILFFSEIQIIVLSYSNWKIFINKEKLFGAKSFRNSFLDPADIPKSLSLLSALLVNKSNCTAQIDYFKTMHIYYVLRNPLNC